MRMGAIIFARMNSSRLPGKALLPIGQRPLLGWVLDRVARVRDLAQVVVATSTSASDDPIAAFAAAAGVDVYRGSLDNVVARALACARVFELDAFARVCGDRVFLEPTDIEAAMAQMAPDGSRSVDLVTNNLTRPVPAGLTTEVVRADALADILRQTSNAQDLEHLTRFFYRHVDHFRIVSAREIPAELQGVRFVVDTPEDLDRARWIVERLDDPVATPLTEIATLARAWEAQPSRPQYA
jgi:spore coat polysaccharide biosynthesis protein SpsF